VVHSKKYHLKLDRDLVAAKMKRYGKREGETFSATVLERRIKEIARMWGREMGRLIANPPSYETVATELKSAVNRE